MGKKISSKAEIDKYFNLLRDFPIIHNSLKGDVVLLMNAMVTHEEDTKVDSFYRSILSAFFSMVEADLFYYNQFDPYDGYRDYEKFNKKFKKTFEQICSTWGKTNLLNEYYDNDNGTIFDLKIIRNGISHPKKVSDINSKNNDEIEKVLSCYLRYVEFISKLMKNFFLDVQGDSNTETSELFAYLQNKFQIENA